MDKKISTNTQNKLDTLGAKRLVLALAVSSTLGFWAYFSKINSDQSASTKAETSGMVPAMQTSNQVFLNLPPMPTLIPPLGATNLTVAGQSPSLTPTPAVPPVLTAPKPGKVFMGGDKVSTGGSKNSPITKTGSSK